jgi:hypothetical protein
MNRPVPANDVDAGSALDSGTVWRRQRSSKVIASGRVGVVYLTAEFFPFLFLAAFRIFSKLRLVNDEAWFESHPRLRHFSP